MKPNRSKSFTIIETLVAITLFLILIISFLSALWVSFDYLRRVMEMRTAALVLQEEASIVRNLDYDAIAALGSTFTSSGMASLKDASGTIIKSPYNGYPNILKITFEIDWTTFGGKPASKTIVTLMTDHGINKK